MFSAVYRECLCFDDQVNELQRALRHIDLNELADAVDRCYQQDAELSDLPVKNTTPADDTPPT